MNICKLSSLELASKHKSGEITSEQLEAEIERRSVFLLSSVISRFVAKENADWQLYGASEGSFTAQAKAATGGTHNARRFVLLWHLGWDRLYCLWTGCA